MKNSTVNPTKKVSTTKNETVKNENLESVLDSINFDSLEKKIDIKSKIEEKQSSVKNLLYKFETDKTLSDKERKSKRTKLRKLRTNFENDILKFYKENKNTELKESLKSFIKFYKDNYILNDFSLYSIISNNTDTEKMKRTEECLSVIKEILKIK